MARRTKNEGNRHNFAMPYLTAEMSSILSNVEKDLNDTAIVQSTYFSPTALTHVKRLLENGGTIVTDTKLIASGIDTQLVESKGARVSCFIDEPNVIDLAAHRRITRAEVAVDFGLAEKGLKLLVVGSAPSAIGRILYRRQHEPMTDVCVLAAPTGFTGAVQIKEKLVESDLTSIVIRGKKGGVPMTIALLNAILHEITKASR